MGAKKFMLKRFMFAKPFSPYSIQKCPEPQICPKFVPAIVFGGSSQGIKNMKKIVNICLKITVFDKFLTPWLEPPKTIAGTNFGQIWGSGRF